MAECISPNTLWVFVGASMALGVITGTLAGLLYRHGEVQRLVARLHKSGWHGDYQKAKGSDVDDEHVQENAALWEMATSDDEESDYEEVDPSEELKMILCVRTDLQMGKGKMCAQAAHGALALYQRCHQRNYEPLGRWTRQGQRKIAVKVSSENELNSLHAAALQRRLPAILIHDAGRTQIPGGTPTVLAIGPGTDAQLNQVTGHLKLL